MRIRDPLAKPTDGSRSVAFPPMDWWPDKADIGWVHRDLTPRQAIQAINFIFNSPHNMGGTFASCKTSAFQMKTYNTEVDVDYEYVSLDRFYIYAQMVFLSESLVRVRIAAIHYCRTTLKCVLPKFSGNEGVEENNGWGTCTEAPEKEGNQQCVFPLWIKDWQR